MGISLKKRTNKDGSTTLMLDIFHDGQRSYERLENLKLAKSTNPIVRQENKEKLALAKKIVLERAKQLAANDYGIDTEAAKKVNVVVYLQNYVDKYKLKDKRNMQGALNRFRDYLIEQNLEGLTMRKLTEELITDFRDYLIPLSIGEGAASYFQRYKKMVKAMAKAFKMPNPAQDVKVKGLGNSRKKDTLTLDEIKALANTPIQSNEVRIAFLFSCLTGLRWIDVKALQWENLNLKSEKPYLKITQSKTNEEVKINLNHSAIKVLAGTTTKKKGIVFDLPTANGANKTIKAWVRRANIDKVITWHNARHSFGTNLIFNDVDILTTSKLLGHTSLKHTQRYVKASEEMKQNAVDKIEIDF